MPLIFSICIVIINTMPYRVNQKIGNHVYVYEVESYWDTAKKQPRQRRRYLGRMDPQTGEILHPHQGFTPRAARDFGHIYLTLNIVNRIGLSEVLKEVFPDLYQELLYLSIFQVLESKPLYLFQPWAEATYLKEPLELSSQRISRLAEELGKSEDLQQKFFHSWIRDQGDIQAVLFDITSLSSYSKLIEYLEWGYNRDQEKLPQINLGVVVGQPSCLPLAYRVYPGSIADVSTLRNVVVLLGEFGLKEFTFILDRGFYSATNIKEMKSEGISFVVPLPFSTKTSHHLISKHLRDLQSPRYGFYYRGRPMFHIKEEITIADVLLSAHIYHDERRKADEVDHLMRRIVEIEALVKEKEFWDRQALEEYMEQSFKGSSKLFEVTEERPRFKLMRKVNAISRLMNRMGKTIILTNDPELGREDILSLYRRKDTLEKMFDIIKNELDCRRLKVSSREAVEGRIFLTYLSLIIYSALSRIMRENDLYRTYTLSEVFYELKKLRAVTLNSGKSYLTEVSKKQRILFEKFDVPVPVVPSY